MYIEKLKKKYSTPLYRVGIRTDEDLVKKSYEELLKIRNFGPSGIEVVNQQVRIPMGLEPLVKPEPAPMHPNRKAAIDEYWEKVRSGEIERKASRKRRKR